MDILETTYDYFLRAIFGIANPVKKTIIKTQCKVHKAINIYALKILKNDEYFEEYFFFSKAIYRTLMKEQYGQTKILRVQTTSIILIRRGDYMVEKMLWI